MHGGRMLAALAGSAHGAVFGMPGPMPGVVTRCCLGWTGPCAWPPLDITPLMGRAGRLSSVHVGGSFTPNRSACCWWALGRIWQMLLSLATGATYRQQFAERCMSLILLQLALSL